MSFEERSTSWVLSLFDALESHDHIRPRILAAAGGTLVTVIIWVVHLRYFDILHFLIELDDWAKPLVGFLLAPPFVVAFTVGSFIYPQPIQSLKENDSGPMSTYFYRERASRRWKLLIAAGIFAAVNFLLMFISSGM